MNSGFGSCFRLLVLVDLNGKYYLLVLEYGFNVMVGEFYILFVLLDSDCVLGSRKVDVFIVYGK